MRKSLIIFALPEDWKAGGDKLSIAKEIRRAFRLFMSVNNDDADWSETETARNVWTFSPIYEFPHGFVVRDTRSSVPQVSIISGGSSNPLTFGVSHRVAEVPAAVAFDKVNKPKMEDENTEDDPWLFRGQYIGTVKGEVSQWNDAELCRDLVRPDEHTMRDSRDYWLYW